jgi:hypothetical protein
MADSMASGEPFGMMQIARATTPGRFSRTHPNAEFARAMRASDLMSILSKQLSERCV